MHDRPHARARIEINNIVGGVKKFLDRPHARARIEMKKEKKRKQ